jgi:hypothetical protein
MRVLPAIRVKGRIAREVSGIRKTLTTAFAGGAKAGRQHACTFNTFDVAHSAKVGTGFAKRMRVTSEVRGLKRAYRLQEPGADFPPMTAGAQTSRPVRPDSPDLIDGSHGWAWI